MTVPSTESIFTNISNLLGRLRNRQKGTWILSAFITGFAFMLAVGMTGALIEAVAWLDPGSRKILAWVTLGGITLGMGLAVVLSVILLITRNYPGNHELARVIWRKDALVRDRILDAIELSEHPDTLTSSELRSEAVRRIDKEASTLDPSGYVRLQSLRLALRLVAWTTAICMVTALFSWRSLAGSIERLTHPGNRYLKPGTVLLELEMPDTLNLIQGQTVELEVRAKHYLPSSITFQLDEGAGISRTVQAIPDTGDNSLFRATVGKVDRSMNVYASSDKAVSDTSFINVVSRPRIARLEVIVRPPAYTGLEPLNNPEGSGDISALPGSRVEVRVEASKQLREARLVLGNPSGGWDSTFLAVEGRLARGGFRVNKQESWWLEFVADDGVPGDEPLKWSINLLEDYPPGVEVKLPEHDAEIPESMLMPLLVIADDDYGISRAVLRFRIYNELLSPDSVGEELFRTIPLKGRIEGPGRFVVQTLWSLSDLPLLPTEEVHYFIEVWDNDSWKGPKRARSELRKLVFPSLDDLFTRVNQDEEQADTDIRRALERAESVKEKLETTLERMRSNPEELSWEETQALEQTLENQQDLLKSLEQVARSLEELQETFVEHEMINHELLDKYQQLQELIREIATPELQEAMERLQEAMEKQDGMQLREALEQLAMDQEAFVESLERSLSILKQLQAERRMEELAQRAQDLAQRQKELAERLDSDNTLDMDHEALRQEHIEKDFEALMSELKEASEQLSDDYPELADSLDRLASETDEAGLQDKLEETTGQLREGHRSKAGKSAERNYEGLEKIAQRLGGMHQQMVQQGKEKLAAEMDRLIQQLLLVSRRQEQLRTESGHLRAASPRYRELAAWQEGVLDALDVTVRSAEELTKQTFFVGAQLLGELISAQRHMDNAISRYTDRRPRDVTGEQGQALAAIHRGLRKLSQAQESLSQSSSSSGYQEMMDKLSQMSAQQQALNQATQSMPMPVPGQMPGGDQLSQIAARQRALSEAMRQLEQESMSMEDLLGSLEGLGNAMEEVANDLEDRNITERTRRLQKRILQRLLDSQRSLQEREHSRERLSQTGEDIRRGSPGSLPATRENLLRERMIRALESDFSQSWRQVIRSYFRALEKEVENKSDNRP